MSEAVPNNTSQLSSPIINTRTVSTQLSLQDGATVLLGGLIMENANSTSTGIPGLKDIPGVGFLFGTQNVRKPAVSSSCLSPPISSIPVKTRQGLPKRSSTNINHYPNRHRVCIGDALMDAAGDGRPSGRR